MIKLWCNNDNDDVHHDIGDDSGSGGKDRSLNSLPAMIEACDEVRKETSDADCSALAGQFGALIKFAGALPICEGGASILSHQLESKGGE